MARPFHAKILTANRLLEGDVVYLAKDSSWVTDIKDARLIDDETQANSLLQQAKTRPDLLVGVYLADAQLHNGHPAPVHFREDFRASGPSNYQHGKRELHHV